MERKVTKFTSCSWAYSPRAASGLFCSSLHWLCSSPKENTTYVQSLLALSSVWRAFQSLLCCFLSQSLYVQPLSSVCRCGWNLPVSDCCWLAVVAAKHTSYKFSRASAWWGVGLVLVIGKDRIEAKSCAVSTHCWPDRMRRFVKVGSGGSKEQKSPCSTASIPFICHGGILALPASLPLVKCPPPTKTLCVEKWLICCLLLRSMLGGIGRLVESRFAPCFRAPAFLFWWTASQILGSLLDPHNSISQSLAINT